MIGRVTKISSLKAATPPSTAGLRVAPLGVVFNDDLVGTKRPDCDMVSYPDSREEVSRRSSRLVGDGR